MPRSRGPCRARRRSRRGSAVEHRPQVELGVGGLDHALAADEVEQHVDVRGGARAHLGDGAEDARGRGADLLGADREGGGRSGTGRRRGCRDSWWRRRPAAPPPGGSSRPAPSARRRAAATFGPRATGRAGTGAGLGTAAGPARAAAAGCGPAAAPRGRRRAQRRRRRRGRRRFGVCGVGPEEGGWSGAAPKSDWVVMASDRLRVAIGDSCWSRSTAGPRRRQPPARPCCQLRGKSDRNAASATPAPVVIGRGLDVRFQRLRVLFALVVREMSTKFGRSYGGYSGRSPSRWAASCS